MLELGVTVVVVSILSDDCTNFTIKFAVPNPSPAKVRVEALPAMRFPVIEDKAGCVMRVKGAFAKFFFKCYFFI